MNDNTPLKADPRTLRFPPLEEEAERQLQAQSVFLPTSSTWPQIKKRIFWTGCGPFSDPESWEMTMKAFFGEDLFTKRHEAP